MMDANILFILIIYMAGMAVTMIACYFFGVWLILRKVKKLGTAKDQQEIKTRLSWIKKRQLKKEKPKAKKKK